MHSIKKASSPAFQHPVDSLTEHDIAQCLQSAFQRPTQDIPAVLAADQYRQAAVLAPLIRDGGRWHLLFIRRAVQEGDHHSGQVAFAGGKREEQDRNLHETALRETWEEIGVRPRHVRILGELPPHHSVSRFRITPVVGCMPWPYPLVLQRSEVGRTFTIPLAWLADPANHELRDRLLAPGTQPVRVPYFREYDGELLWGATARMTLSLVNLLQG
ncbi:MAG: CoA pyrophosphatase [Thiolinea sp.]